MARNSNDVSTDCLQPEKQTECGDNILRACFQEQNKVFSTYYDRLVIFLLILSQYVVSANDLEEEYMKKDVRELLFRSPYPSFGAFTTKNRVGEQEELRNAQALSVDNCSSEHYPVADKNDSSTPIPLSHPTRSRAPLDKAARKRFRSSFVLTDQPAHQKDTGGSPK